MHLECSAISKNVILYISQDLNKIWNVVGPVHYYKYNRDVYSACYPVQKSILLKNPMRRHNRPERHKQKVTELFSTHLKYRLKPKVCDMWLNSL